MASKMVVSLPLLGYYALAFGIAHCGIAIFFIHVAMDLPCKVITVAAIAVYVIRLLRLFTTSS